MKKQKGSFFMKHCVVQKLLVLVVVLERIRG